MHLHRTAAAAVAAMAALTLPACGSSTTAGTSSTPAATSSSLAASTPAASLASSASSASSPAASTPADSGTIVAVAAADPEFSTFVSAVKAAGLVNTLNGSGPFTVFAPTNQAFAALPPGVLHKLLLPANKATLVKVLTYHVLPAKVIAAEVKPGKHKTLEGREITITAGGGGVKVGGATVTKTDVEASNGVIHAIDKVLVPANVNLSKL